jgi:hypothetical protein
MRRSRLRRKLFGPASREPGPWSPLIGADMVVEWFSVH